MKYTNTPNPCNSCSDNCAETPCSIAAEESAFQDKILEYLRNTECTEEDLDSLIAEALDSVRNNLQSQAAKAKSIRAEEVAKAQREKQQKEAQAQSYREAKLQEARANLINALLAYNEVYHFIEEEITAEDIAELQSQIAEAEEQLAELIKLAKKLDSLGLNLKQESPIFSLFK